MILWIYLNKGNYEFEKYYNNQDNNFVIKLDLWVTKEKIYLYILGL